MDQPGENRSGQSFGFQQNTNMNSDATRNRQVPEAPRLDAIPIPQDIPFSNANPTSFAQLSNNIIQPVTSATSLSANIYSHTLSQYGPAIIEQQQSDSPILRPQVITTPTIVSRPMGGIEINPEYNFVGLNETRPAPAAISTTATPSHLMFTRPAAISSTTSLAPLSAGAVLLNNNRANEPTRDELIYSPPLVERDDALAINPNSGRPMGLDGRIPKKSNDKTPIDSAETLLDLQKLYRSYDDRFKSEKSARDRLDRDISSMMRGHRGQSIELDPIFCKMKDMKKRHESEMDRIEADLKKVESKMMARFNYRMARQTESSDPISSNPVQQGKRQTAKMSTGTPYNSSKTKDNQSVDKKDIILDLRDTNTWCNVCDLHFNNLREFAKHLHSHEHSGRTRKSTPWRPNSTANARWDKNKTYQTMKSICSKLTNENDRNFTVNDIDRILNPNVDPKDPEMKSRFVARERGRFDDDDPLFKIRGYDLIVPMNGFYCQLCNRALCDSLELEKHVMSYEHTYSHLKSMSLNSEHERRLRASFIKSYQKEFPPVDEESDADRPRGKRSTEDRRKDKSTSQQPQTAPRAYKKLTSSIVDDHEALKGLVPPAAKRPPSSLSADENATTKGANVESSPGKKRRFESSVPEIQPLSRTTGALKRLRNPPLETVSSELTKEPTETTAEGFGSNDLEAITSSSEEEAENRQAEKQKPKVTQAKDKTPKKKAKRVVDEAKIVDADDPNNPFPGIRLSMYSNQHDDILTDKRLAQECIIKLFKLDLSEFGDLVIMDSASKWSRIDSLMAKRENIKENNSNAVTKTHTEPTFFSMDGQRIPVDLNELASDKFGHVTTRQPSTMTTTSLADKTDSNQTKKIIVEELETGDNGDDAVDDATQNKEKTKSVKNEVMFTDEENEEEKPVDVNSYMTALNDFFLEK